MGPEEVGNALSASSILHLYIFCITMADPNMPDVTNDVQYMKITAQLFSEKCYKLCNFKSPILLCQASGPKSSIGEPLGRFCALPFQLRTFFRSYGIVHS